ncbi:hypothetical protein AAG602_15955 [Citromicrobium bathyomarinum]
MRSRLLSDDRLGIDLVPSGIGGQDQADRAARQTVACRDRFGGQRCNILYHIGRADPERIWRCQGRDIRIKRSIECAVICRMVADHVDDRRARAPGVMQVRRTIGIARPEMQQRAGGNAGHSRIAVGRAARHAFEQAQHRSHARFLIERRDELHLARPRIGETYRHIVGDEGGQQSACSIHSAFSLSLQVCFCMPFGCKATKLGSD